MANNKQTSKKVAKAASDLLRNPKTPKKIKAVAASALAQTRNSKAKKRP